MGPSGKALVTDIATPIGLWSSLQAGPLQGGIDHLTIRLWRAQKQRLFDAGSKAASRNQILEWDGVPRSPALGDVVGMETERVTWVRKRGMQQFPVTQGC